MRVVIFLMPMIQMTIFGFAISTEVRGIRLAVQRAPSDELAAEIERRSFASTWFVPATVTGNDAFQWVQAGQADVVLVVPPNGLTRAFARGEGQVQILLDATNVVRAQSSENYIKSIIARVAAERIEAPPSPLSFDIRILYNPSMVSSVFMVPGVMSLILCVVTVLLTSMSIARELEIGTMETIISAPVSKTEVLLGKTIPYVVLGMLDMPLVIAAAVFLFDVPMRGQLPELAAAGFVFIVSTVSIGTLISAFAKTQQQAMMGGFIFLFIATLLSGFMFPIDNLPAPLLVVTWLNPLTYFVDLLRNIMLKGGEPTVFWTNLAVLAGLGSVAGALAYRRFRSTLQ
jgi:ABC-2 type transport system permease protein